MFTLNWNRGYQYEMNLLYHRQYKNQWAEKVGYMHTSMTVNIPKEMTK